MILRIYSNRQMLVLDVRNATVSTKLKISSVQNVILVVIRLKRRSNKRKRKRLHWPKQWLNGVT